MLRITVLVTNNQDAYADIKWAIDDGVRKAMQWEPAPLLTGGRAEVGILDQELGHAFELVQETDCDGTTGLSAIEANCASEVEFSASGCSSKEFGAHSFDRLGTRYRSRRATFDLCVPHGCKPVPGHVSRSVCVETGDHSIEESSALYGRQAKQLGFQCFDGQRHDMNPICKKLQ